jgi:hypothetical protein
MSRGGREGNNALTKDLNPAIVDGRGPSLAGFALGHNVPKATLDQLISLKICEGCLALSRR